MVGGISRDARRLRPLFSAYGLVPLQAGGSGSAPPGGRPARTRLRDGSPPSDRRRRRPPSAPAPMSSATAWRLRPPVPERGVGRAADGQRAGEQHHPEPDDELRSAASPPPAAASSPTAPSSSSSFGGRPVPIEVRVLYTDGSLDRTYRLPALHPHRRCWPAAAIMQSVAGTNDLPQLTVEYDLTVGIRQRPLASAQQQERQRQPHDAVHRAGNADGDGGGERFERCQ